MKNMKKVLAVTAAVAMTAAMMPTAVFADDAETFKIGVIGPMTGDNAQYGLGVYHAAQVAAEEINANGGFNGYNVEILDAGDDQADPEKAVNAYNDLLDKGMQMLCGTVTSGSCIAVGAEAAESTFMFTPSATAVDSITAGSNEFRMCSQTLHREQNLHSTSVSIVLLQRQQFSMIHPQTTTQVSTMRSLQQQKKTVWKLQLMKHTQQTATQTSLYSLRKSKTAAQNFCSFLTTMQTML